MESNAHFISPAEAISDLRRLVESRFDADSQIRKDLLKAIDVVTVTFKSSCNEADRRLQELEGEVHRAMDEADRKWQSELEILLAIRYKDCISELEAKHAKELRIREEEFKAKVEEVRHMCQEELQDHIDDLVEELAACREDAAADRQTIQHLVAVVAKLVK